MSHIFISYNHENNDFAENLIHRLHEASFTTWRDVDKLSAGEIWRVEIDQAIKDAFAMIVIMTPKAKTSEYVTYEWAFAFGVGVKVIPVMLSPTELHPRLEDVQYLDFTGKFRPWDKLIEAVRKTVELKRYNKNHTLQKIPSYVQQAITGLNSLKATEREEAIQSLAKTDHPAGHEALIEGLEHPLKEIRIQIGLLLAEYKEPKAIPILIDALNSNDNDTCKNAITALTKVGLLAVPDLCRALNDDDRRVRHAAAEVLGEIGDTTAVSDLLKALNDISEDVRVSVAEALGKLKANIASQSLLEVLKNTNNSFLFRGTAIMALANIGDANAASDISECLLNDNDENIRPFAAFALGEIRNTTALPALIAALDDPHFTVRQAAAYALGKIKDTSAIPALQKALHDSNSRVRENIVYALGEIGGTSAIPALIKALQDTDIVITDRTLGALKRIGTSEALAAIQDWRNSKNIE